MKLLNNEEFIKAATKSSTASRKGIDNTPSKEAIENLLLLKTNVYDPLCVQFNTIIPITSGYRSIKLNRAVGGSKVSEHLLGKALDLDLGKLNKQLYKVISTMNYDLLIFEYGTMEEPAWVHVSYSTENKKQNLRVVRINGKPVYTTINPSAI